jgi:hypothetical protein
LRTKVELNITKLSCTINISNLVAAKSSSTMFESSSLLLCRDPPAPESRYSAAMSNSDAVESLPQTSPRPHQRRRGGRGGGNGGWGRRREGGGWL